MTFKLTFHLFSYAITFAANFLRQQWTLLPRWGRSSRWCNCNFPAFPLSLKDTTVLLLLIISDLTRDQEEKRHLQGRLTLKAVRKKNVSAGKWVYVGVCGSKWKKTRSSSLTFPGHSVIKWLSAASHPSPLPLTLPLCSYLASCCTSTVRRRWKTSFNGKPL